MPVPIQFRICSRVTELRQWSLRIVFRHVSLMNGVQALLPSCEVILIARAKDLA